MGVGGSVRAAAALAFAVALRMSLAGRGGSEDEVEEVDEAEDEEEVVDAGWAVMRAGLRAADFLQQQQCLVHLPRVLGTILRLLIIAQHIFFDGHKPI